MFNPNNHKPTTIADMVIASPKTRERLEDYATGDRVGHILLHGPKGTGKSSAADIIAKQHEKRNQDSLFEAVNFPAYEGATITEPQILSIPEEWGRRKQFGMEPATIVINEIDKMSPVMLEKLKATMDLGSGKGQIVATTNNLHKVPPALEDRFQTIEMPALSPDDFVQPVKAVVEAEGYSVTENEVKRVLASSTGSWRDALSAAEDIITRKRKAQRQQTPKAKP